MYSTESLYTALGRKLKVPKDVQIAKELLLLLNNEPKTIKSLVEELKTTEPFLYQISSKLNKAGLITTVRGRKGGLKINE